MRPSKAKLSIPLLLLILLLMGIMGMEQQEERCRAPARVEELLRRHNQVRQELRDKRHSRSKEALASLARRYFYPYSLIRHTHS
jgi:hypothetical protein